MAGKYDYLNRYELYAKSMAKRGITVDFEGATEQEWEAIEKGAIEEWKKLQSKRLKEEERRGQQQAGPGPSAPRPTARASDGRLLSVVKAEIESQKAYGN